VFRNWLGLDTISTVDTGLNYATAGRGACHPESGTYRRGYGVEWPGWQECPSVT